MRAAFHTSVAVLALLTIPMTASAADLKPAPLIKAPIMAPIFSWTGFYIGGNFGGAWDNTTITDSLFGLNFSNGNNAVFVGGGQVGGGFEGAFANNWSMRAEYDYFGLSGGSFTVPAPFPILAGDTFTTGKNNIQMATVGINYRFGMYGM